MGYEPFMRAIEAGAEVVIAGRAFDPAMMGAHALLRGFDRGLTVHMGKLLECGGAAAYPRHGSDGLLATLYRDSFTVEPPNPDKVCTVASVAAHSLYERANPYHMEFPGGAIDLHATRFEQESERVVRISGTRYIEAPHYTIKLEGVERVGYRTIAIAGVRDPILISRFDDYVANIRSRVAERYPDGYRLTIHSYGRNGVMGPIEAARAEPAVRARPGVRSHRRRSRDLGGGPRADPVGGAARHLSRPKGHRRQPRLSVLAIGHRASARSTSSRIHHLVKVEDPCAPFAMDLFTP